MRIDQPQLPRVAMLARVVALEMEQYGVTANAISPIAATRMLASIGREAWVHFQLASDDLGRGIRARNASLIREASASADEDISVLRDRVLKR